MEAFFNWVFEKKSRFFALVLLLSLFLRISALHYPFLDVDESQFAGFAHVLMDGGLPYQDSVDTKPPLIYLFYWLCFALLGKYNMAGVHLAGILVSVGVALTLYRIGRESGQEKAGHWAALLYAVFSTTYLPKFIAVSITSVMVLPLTLAILYWLKGGRHLKKRRDWIAGALCGIAFLFKYQAGIQIGVIFFFLLWNLRLEGTRALKTAVARYTAFLSGFLTPIVLTVGVLFLIGVGPDFIQWSLKGSAHYIEAGSSTIPFFKNLFVRGGSFLLASLLLWILLGVFCFKKPARFSSLERLLLVWLTLSFVPVATGGRFYGHYFLQLLPPLCLIGGIALSRLNPKKWLKPTLALMLVPALIFWALRLDQKKIYELFPDDALHEQEAVGQWLKANTQPGETLFVWGFATAIYFHSELKPASRFLWADLLTGKVPGSRLSNDPAFDTQRFARPEAWAAFWEDVNQNPPAYFVDTSPANIHDYGKYPVHRYLELNGYLQDHYSLWKNIGGCMIYRKKN